jgi:hypothetical protein
VKYKNIEIALQTKIKFNKNNEFALLIELFNYLSTLNELKNNAIWRKID